MKKNWLFLSVMTLVALAICLPVQAVDCMAGENCDHFYAETLTGNPGQAEYDANRMGRSGLSGSPGLMGNSVVKAAPMSEYDDGSIPAPLGSKVLVYLGNGSVVVDTFTLLTAHYTGLSVTTDVLSTWPSSLAGYKLVYLMASTTAYSAGQITDLTNLLKSGGRVVLVGEWESFWGVGAEAALNTLLGSLGSSMFFDPLDLDLGCGNVWPVFTADSINAGIGGVDAAAGCGVAWGLGTILFSDSGIAFSTSAVEGTSYGPRPGFDIVAHGDVNAFSDVCSPANGQFWTNLYSYSVPTFIVTDTELPQQTLVTKSVMNFTVCYSNVSGQVLGDDETVTAQLQALLFANGKSAGDFSSLLATLPVMSPGATWCDSFTATVPNTTKSKKVQKVLRVPMRTEVRVKINGVVDAGSQSYETFRVEERDAFNEYWMIGNDEGHDINPLDGFGGTTSPAVEIGPPDSVFGNEGFGYVSYPNLATDAVGVYGVSPPNAGGDLALGRVDFGVANFGPSSATPAFFGVYENWITGYGNRPNLAAPIYGPVSGTPMLYNSTSGGDHGTWVSAGGASLLSGQPVWAIYFFGAGREDAVAWDKAFGGPAGAGAVDFESFYMSTDGFATTSNPIPIFGNWIVGFHVFDVAGAFPSGGVQDLPAYEGWQKAALNNAFNK